MSTNTGTAPCWIAALAVAMKVYGVVITSSPGPMPNALSAIWSARVPFGTQTPKRAPWNSAKRCSNWATFAPPMPHWPERSTSNRLRSSRSS